MDVSGLEPNQLETLAAIGMKLRHAREAQGWSIEQAANASLLRVQYIKALESADFATLPEPVYVRGFFKKYGDLLGLNGATLASQFSRVTAELEVETPPVTQQPLGDRASETSVLLRPEHLLLFFIPFAIVVVVLADVLGNQNNPLARFQRNRDRPFETLSDWTYIQDVFPEQEVATTAVATTPAPTPAIPQPVDEKPIQVGVRVAEQASWMRVMVDGRIVFEGTLEPGTVRGWSAFGALSVLAGNAGAVRLFINSEDAGTMGAFGEVRQRLVQ
ncbi:MAG: RodZ domain-containing protein [Cyanobacteria bacterium J06642_2]